MGTRVLLAAFALYGAAATAPKVILTIIVDDLAWHNVGWHNDAGSAENGTPHLLALAQSGVILDRHYCHFTCTPSRSSFLTGRLPVHVQQTLANPDVATAGIPRNMTALPARLAEAGFRSHVVGKWDAGASTAAHTPAGRGFNGSLVYFEHMNYYYTQNICPTGTSCNMSKYNYLRDLWDGNRPAQPNPTDAYIEYLFAERLLDIIAAHDMAAGPLYLQYNSHVTHWPLQVPKEWYDKFLWVEDDEAACGDDIPRVWPGANKTVVSCRRQLLAMIALVDEIVGNVTAAIRARGWYNDTLILFTPDNGGSVDTSENAGSNYPLRGGKYDGFEGGIRTAAFVSGGYVPPVVRGTVLDAPISIADWFSTFLGLVGVNPFDIRANTSSPVLPPVDSLDVWPLISGTNASSPRTELPVSPQILMQFEPDGGPIYKLMLGAFGRAGWQVRASSSGYEAVLRKSSWCRAPAQHATSERPCRDPHTQIAHHLRMTQRLFSITAGAAASLTYAQTLLNTLISLRRSLHA